MEAKLTKLLITINRLSAKLSGVCQDLDKIAQCLQEPEIVALTCFDNSQTISTEDYE